MTQAKPKLSENTQTNFNHSKEIVYWAKQYKIEPAVFQKIFEESGHSITKTLQHLTAINNLIVKN